MNDGHTKLAQAILDDEDKLRQVVALFNSADPTDDERFAAIDIVRAHIERERDVVREAGHEPEGWAAVGKIDDRTYEIETLLHDLSEPVYKDAVDFLGSELDKHIAWDEAVMAPLADSLSAEAAERIYRIGDV